MQLRFVHLMWRFQAVKYFHHLSNIESRHDDEVQPVLKNKTNEINSRRSAHLLVDMVGLWYVGSVLLIFLK